VDVLIAPRSARRGHIRDQAQVLRARLEEIAREFADDPAILVTMVPTMTERVQAKPGDIEAQLADARRGRCPRLSRRRAGRRAAEFGAEHLLFGACEVLEQAADSAREH
jgi:hypothetical protein